MAVRFLFEVASAFGTNDEPSALYQFIRKRLQLKVTDPEGELVCITRYRKGAKEVVRRLEHLA